LVSFTVTYTASTSPEKPRTQGNVTSSTQQTPFLLNTGQHPRMGFELHQPPFRFEAVNEFMDQMKDTPKEAKSALTKAKDNMAQYYNHHHSPAPSFSPSDMVYLDSKDIQTTRPSKKLSHHRLGPYLVERHIGKYAYHLVLPPLMRHLHPVFNVVKLSPAPNNPIVRRCQNPPQPPELVDGEEEYVVEKILNSRMFEVFTVPPHSRWKGTSSPLLITSLPQPSPPSFQHHGHQYEEHDTLQMAMRQDATGS